MSTIRDVAKAAAVSPTTVSRYLNGQIKLAPDTEQRLNSAIIQLNYRPNGLAKRLRMGKSEALGIVTPDIADPFFAELASAAEKEAARHGYSLLVSSSGGDRDRELAALQRLEDQYFDGLIIITNRPDDGTLAAGMNRHKNVVLIDEDIGGVTAPKVVVENRRGGYLATRSLIDVGHRAIAYVGGPVDLYSAVERLSGHLDAMLEAGLTSQPEHVLHGDYTREFGAAAFQTLMSGDTKPTAIFAGSGSIALGILKVCQGTALRIPDDLSLVCFDDMDFADLLAPALTTVRQPTSDLGRVGINALLSVIDGRKMPALTRLSVDLIERQSVAPPRA